MDGDGRGPGGSESRMRPGFRASARGDPRADAAAAWGISGDRRGRGEAAGRGAARGRPGDGARWPEGVSGETRQADAPGVASRFRYRKVTLRPARGLGLRRHRLPAPRRLWGFRLKTSRASGRGRG